jgi:hypothetical protein
MMMMMSGHQLFTSQCKTNVQVWLGNTRFHDHTNRDLFEKWLVNKWISNVPPNAVAVFINVLHYWIQTDYLLTMYTSKQDKIVGLCNKQTGCSNRIHNLSFQYICTNVVFM